MDGDNTLARSIHDLGLATWFGGSLMGAVGLNGVCVLMVGNIANSGARSRGAISFSSRRASAN